MDSYNYSGKSIRTYLQHIYTKGLQKSNYLSDDEVEEIITNIGIFKFKGYYFAFKENITNHSIDDVLMVYFFDKYLTRIIMDLTSSIETKLKTVLVELCYEKIRNLSVGHPSKDNPFFYLLKDNYKIPNFKINNVTVSNWKADRHSNHAESYTHYGLYYKNKYDFISISRSNYISGHNLIATYPDINYPPFHYIIESATLGGVIGFIKHLKIDNYDILRGISSHFGVTNPRVSFKPYLERLNEVRNRAAHRERLFNRSYRSITRMGHYRTLSHGLQDHKFIDLYMYLFFMLDKIDGYRDAEIFMTDEIERLFRGFRKDYYIRHDSKMLTKKIKRKEFDKIKKFMIRGMK